MSFNLVFLDAFLQVCFAHQAIRLAAIQTSRPADKRSGELLANHWREEDVFRYVGVCTGQKTRKARCRTLLTKAKQPRIPSCLRRCCLSRHRRVLSRRKGTATISLGQESGRLINYEEQCSHSTTPHEQSPYTFVYPPPSSPTPTRTSTKLQRGSPSSTSWPSSLLPRATFQRSEDVIDFESNFFT